MAILGVGNAAPVFSMVPALGPFRPAAILPAITEEDRIILNNVQKIVRVLNCRNFSIKDIKSAGHRCCSGYPTAASSVARHLSPNPPRSAHSINFPGISMCNPRYIFVICFIADTLQFTESYTSTI